MDKNDNYKISKEDTKDMYKVHKETIKCFCGWDSHIGRINHLVIYYDIICPLCGSVVIKGIYDKENAPVPYYPKGKKPWREQEYFLKKPKYKRGLGAV